MKTLYVLRHAESDWDAPCGRDHERPLSPRGVTAAARVGRFLESHGWPERVLSSSAVRARTTVELACEQASAAPPVKIVPEIYEAGVADILLVLAHHAGDSGSVMTAGHEPTCSALLQTLAGTTCRFPTAGLARIDLDLTRWADAPNTGARRGVLRWFVTPKILAVEETSQRLMVATGSGNLEP